MTEISITTTEHLLRHLNELPNNFIYRGEADAGRSLQSSLERVIGESWSEELAARFESYSLDQFVSKFHLYDRENKCPDSTLAWLSIMQHYGVPTRLLDFTQSPYVALYFAMEAYDPRKKNDLAIYCLDYSAVMEKSIALIREQDPNFTETPYEVYQKQDQIFEKTVMPHNYDLLWITEPKQGNSRLDRQAGSFLVSGNKGKRIAELLASTPYENCRFEKLIVHRDLYEGIFALLRKMNVTSKSIYGDLNGLARSIKMQLQIYAT